jgi:hypothetical protein
LERFVSGSRIEIVGSPDEIYEAGRMAWWLGVAIGMGVMGGYAALRLLTHRLAQRQRDVRSFLAVELGGLLGRVMLVLGSVVLVLGFAPVNAAAFAGTVVSLLILSIVVEVGLLVRHLS